MIVDILCVVLALYNATLFSQKGGHYMCQHFIFEHGKISCDRLSMGQSVLPLFLQSIERRLESSETIKINWLCDHVP